MSEIQDDGYLEGVKNFFARQMEREIERDRMIAEGRRAAMDQYTPSAGQLANFGGMLLPMAGTADASGEYPTLPSYDQPLGEAFSGEAYPSMAENIERGGFGGNFDASMQGLGVAGDALYAMPIIGPVVGPTLGTALKATGAAGKGIAALARTKQALRADVDKYARDNTGLTSPTIQALIEKAPPNLKGPQITQWAKANANKGVKPKELEFLGLEEFIDANPNATTREAVEGISANKVIVNTEIRGGGGVGDTLEFERSFPDEDPLDGSKLWENDADNIRYEIGEDDYYATQDLLEFANNRYVDNTLGRTRDKPFESIEDLESHLSSINDSYRTVDDLIEGLAENNYRQNPYEMIRPQGEEFGDGTFAFGNDDVGYSIFINGERPTDITEIPYDATSAKFDLGSRLGFGYGDGLENVGDDFRLYRDGEGPGSPGEFKSFVDGSLPGGTNYREVVFRWDNAPTTHDFGHFVDAPDQIAHALIRDRKLADGTDALHIDELQSDLHTQGSRLGYAPKNEELREANNQISEFIDGVDTTNLPQTDVSFEFFPAGAVGTNETRFGVATNQSRLEVAQRVSAPDGSDSRLLARPFYENDIRNIASMIQDRLVFDPDSAIYNPITYPGFRVPGPQYGSKEADMLVEALGEDINKLNDLFETSRANTRGVPNYPYKEDWYDMGLKKILLQAIEEGKPALSVSGSVAQKERYADDYSKFYEMLYDKKIPSAMKKLANKYGGEFEKGSLSLDDVFIEASAKDSAMDAGIPEGLGDASIIRITPEMKEKILKEGIQSFGTGGIVDSGIAHLKISPVNYAMGGEVNSVGIQDDGYLEGLKDFFARQMDRKMDRDRMIAEGRRAAIDTFTPTKAQLAYGVGLFAPSSASIEASGGLSEFPSSDLNLQDFPAYMVEGKKLPSMAENLREGGWGGNTTAALQGLGTLGDATYVAGPVVGATFGSLLKAPGAVAKIGKAALKAQRARKGGISEEIDEGIGSLPVATPPQLETEALNRASFIYDDAPPIYEPGSRRLIDAGKEFQEEALNVWGGKPMAMTDENSSIVARNMTSEARESYRRRPEMAGWYKDNLDQAIKSASEIHPELATDPEALTAFKVIMAITSNGQEVPLNAKLTNQFYKAYKKDGKFLVAGSGKEANAMKKGFENANKVIEDRGFAGFQDFLSREYRVRDLKKEGFNVSGEDMDTIVNGSIIFGPKIGGGFMQNLMGNYKPATFDRWWQRTYGRHTGTLIAAPEKVAKQRDAFRTAIGRKKKLVESFGFDIKEVMADDEVLDQFANVVHKNFASGGYKDKNPLNNASRNLGKSLTNLEDAPRGGGQRNFMRKTIAQVRDNLRAEGIEIDTADVQALLWYAEKDLYGRMGARVNTDRVDYATVWREIADAHAASR